MSRWSHHLPILNYHRVGDHRWDHVPTVSPDAFERQLRHLAGFRARVMSLDEVARCLDRGSPLPRRAVVITFDDGYEETHRVAWPLLKRFGFPATVFVAPAEVSLPGFMTWEQIIEVARDGMTIGCHTMSHAYLPLVAEERLADELIQAKRAIEERICRCVDFLSYPVGGFTPRVQAVVREAGYRAACTTNRSAGRHRLDRFALRRIKISERDQNPLLFLAKVSGFYDAFRQLKQPS